MTSDLGQRYHGCCSGYVVRDEFVDTYWPQKDGTEKRIRVRITVVADRPPDAHTAKQIGGVQ